MVNKPDLKRAAEAAARKLQKCALALLQTRDEDARQMLQDYIEKKVMAEFDDALGIRCVMIEDPELTKRLKSRVKPRNGSYARAVNTLHTLTDRKWSRIQKLGRAARWKRIPKAQRSAIMRAVRAGQKTP